MRWLRRKPQYSRTVTVSLTADTSGFDRAMRRATRSTQRARTRTKWRKRRPRFAAMVPHHHDYATLANERFMSTLKATPEWVRMADDFDKATQRLNEAIGLTSTEVRSLLSSLESMKHREAQ